MSHTEIKAELYFASSYSMNISSRDQRAKQNSIQVEQRGEVSRHVTMVANFWVTYTTTRSFCNGDGEQQKKRRFRLAKNTTLQVHHAFLYIS